MKSKYVIIIVFVVVLLYFFIMGGKTTTPQSPLQPPVPLPPAPLPQNTLPQPDGMTIDGEFIVVDKLYSTPLYYRSNGLPAGSIHDFKYENNILYAKIVEESGASKWVTSLAAYSMSPPDYQ